VPIEAGAGSAYDRLIEVLEPSDPASSPDIVYRFTINALSEAMVHVEVKRGRRKTRTLLDWFLRRGEPAEDQRTGQDALRDALIQADREHAVLRYLAKAALEQARDQTTTQVAECLDVLVEETEADREQAAQIEGERERDDPIEILKMLPTEYHEQFLDDYRRALRAAYPAEGYLALRRMLRRWRAAAEVYADPAFHAEQDRSLRAIETGDLSGYRTLEEVRRDAGL
jgi:hypothetical protein